ncbi:MAG: hypothetical protein ACRCXT_11035 [Paraclostridium sp.]
MRYINDYDRIIRENFDITHHETRKMVLCVNENDKNTILSTLTSKLYDSIVNKVNDIDFGNIPNTKGDITQLENYNELVDCLATMNKLLVEFRQDPKPVEIIETALSNLLNRKDLFEKGFKYNIELPIVLYSTIALSIVSSTSFLISACVEFIKSPNQDDFAINIDKLALAKSKDNLLFKNLERFNQSCAKGHIDSSMEYIIDSANKGLTGLEPGIVLGGIALTGIILNIIPILRELIFFFYYSRTRISDYFEVQADLLQINAYNIQNNPSMTKKERDEISKKQMKIVTMFRKISNKFSIEMKQTEQKVNKELDKDKKQYKATDVMDNAPDSTASSLF